MKNQKNQFKKGAHDWLSKLVPPHEQLISLLPTWHKQYHLLVGDHGGVFNTH